MNLIMRRKKLNEIGAGYSISGGSYGNSSQVGSGMGRGIGGRGIGFGSSGTSGGPNLMYTYSIKSLNHKLEPQVISKELEDEIIGIGSRVTGRILNKFSKDKKGKLKPKKIEGVIEKVIKDDKNNILYYVMLDPRTRMQVKIDPTSVQLVKYETSRLMPMTIDNRLDAQSRSHESYEEKFSFVPETLNEAIEKNQDIVKQNEEIRIPIINLTWEKVKPIKSVSVKLPHDFMSSNIIKTDIQFQEWYKEFIKRYGNEGELVGKPNSYGDMQWLVEGNDIWDKSAKQGSDAVSKWYKHGGSGQGQYKGD